MISKINEAIFMINSTERDDIFSRGQKILSTFMEPKIFCIVPTRARH